MIVARQLSAADYADRARFVAAYFEESGNIRQTLYADSVGVPTIGIGFNLRVSTSLNEVLETFGFNLGAGSPDQSYRDRLANVFAANSPSSWQSEADSIMAERAAALGSGRTTFKFFNNQEVYATFDELIGVYESSASALGPDAPQSFERLAIVDMAYNGILSSSVKFRAAYDAGDRAEAWYEIVFNSNYGAARESSGTGIMRRRYLEGELFGLYDKEDGAPGFRPSTEEALRIFRMYNKHENQINGEIALFPRALGNAQIEWNNMLAAYQAEYGEAFGPTTIQPLAVELTPAFAKLVETFVDPSPLAAITAFPAAFAALVDYAPSQIFVAADVRGTNPFHAAEVLARTVDRTGKATANDLIFGSLTAQGTLDAAVADTLRGAAGNDWFVSGGGGDLIDGGTGVDVVDYSNSPAAVGVTLGDGLPESGGFAQGDQVTGVEVVIGSRFGDSLTGGSSGDLLLGAAGSDFLIGGAGSDYLDGGADVDTASYSAAPGSVTIRLWNGTGAGSIAQGDTLAGIENVAGSNFNDNVLGSNGVANWLGGGLGNDYLDGLSGNDTLVGGGGDDTMAGGVGADRLDGGAGADLANYSGATTGVTVRLWSGTGAGNIAAGDVLVGVEHVAGSSFGDALVGANAIANRLEGGGGADYLDGLSGNDTLVGGAGNDTMQGGADNDRFDFSAGSGADRVNDFTAGAGVGDIMRITGYGAALDSFAEILAAAIQVGADTVINLGAGNSITLAGVLKTSLVADDFLFA